jgi:hypothetical protein
MLALAEDGAAAQEWARATRRDASGLHSQLADINVALAEGSAALERGDAADAVATLRVGYDQVVAAGVNGAAKSWLFWRLGMALADGTRSVSDDLFLADQDGCGPGPLGCRPYLAATSRLEPAAIVLGYLDDVLIQPLDASFQRAEMRCHAATTRRVAGPGGHLSLDEAIAVAIAALEDHDQ